MALSKDNNLRNISLGIELFNKEFMKRYLKHVKNKSPSNKEMLSRVEITYNKNIYKDYYVKLISNLLLKSDWYDLFKLNYKDSLKLEYSEYIYLKNILDDYTKATKKQKQDLQNKLNNLEQSIKSNKQ